MDEAYTQHSHHGRKKNRSSTNLNHLTLAPLTTKLPLDEEAYTTRDADYTTPPHTTSYLQGKSAPTTPGILSHSPIHTRTRSSGGRRSSVPHAHAQLPKSKSATHLAATDDARGSHGRRQAKSGTATPTHGRHHHNNNNGQGRRRRANGEGQNNDGEDGDWLMRAGVLMSAEAREFKGQAWLASRASSTSLAGMPDRAEDDSLERELQARQGSRRGSYDIGLGDGPQQHPQHHRSARGSRAGSRSASRAGSRTHLLTPLEGRHSEDGNGGGYFGRGVSVEAAADDYYAQGPDFFNLDEKLEAIDQDTSQEDEAAVRKLVRGERAGAGSWFGWSLFSVEENQEDSSDDGLSGDEGDGAEDRPARRRSSAARHVDGADEASRENIPPPDPNQGGWSDAAWLLSVASKVIL